MGKYKAVLFDFDGTIADTAPGIFACAKYAAEYFGLKIPGEAGLRYFLGPPLLESFSVVLGLEGEDGVLAVKKYRECYTAGEMFNLTFYPGIIELFDELKSKGIKVGICSSKPEKFVRAILEKYEISDKVDLISCPLDDAESESKYSMITRACKTFGVLPQEALMVGDRHLDIKGAVLAGADSCGVLYGYGSEEEFKSCGATFTAENVSDVRSYALLKPEQL